MTRPTFAQRIEKTPRSFVRDILSAASAPKVISFAGGLPDPSLFPDKALAKATEDLFSEQPKSILQYSHTEGDKGLREWIANRYRTKQGLNISTDDILITNGSQQALDLIAKCLLDEGDSLLIEQPGYLGAIQSFSLYQPHYLPVGLSDDGVNLQHLQQHLASHQPKLFYCVPEFQNPSGLSHSHDNRKKVASILKGKTTMLIEDNPYGELRYTGQAAPSYHQLLPEQSILLGSFSKTLAPALRLGWVVAPPWLMEKLLIAKQAADLHSSNLLQAIIYHYLQDNDFDEHLKTVKQHYHHKMVVMREAIKEHFPENIIIPPCEGGMFLWATMPDSFCSHELFKKSIPQGVAFVPGAPFNINNTHSSSLRLNFTNSRDEEIRSGISLLGKLMTSHIKA